MAGSGLAAGQPTVLLTFFDASTALATYASGTAPYLYTYDVTGGTPNGDMTVLATMADLAGNEGSDSDTCLIDTAAPTLAITALTQDGDDVMVSTAGRTAVRGDVAITVTATDADSGLALVSPRWT